MELAGIIYLRQIDQVIVDKNLGLLKQLCGTNYLHRVVLATTKWSRVHDESYAVQRENELREIFWNGMLQKGSTMVRFDYNQESAKKIVNTILMSKRNTDDILRIQKELVELQRYLSQTEAGKSPYSELRKLLVQLKGELTQLEKMKSIERNAEWVVEHNELQERITTIVDEIERMKVPLTARILSLFGLH